MKRKISAFVVGASLVVVTLFTFMPREADANPLWDNKFNGIDCCQGSNAYCYCGPEG